MNSGGLSTATNDVDERLAYVTLALIPAIGARRLASLLGAFGSAHAALRAPASRLHQVPGLTRPVADAIAGARMDTTEHLISRQCRDDAGLVVPSDAAFPAALRTIPDPPVLLWYRGALALLRHPAVAIVGSRNHTAYGAEVARLMAHAAARAEIVVVSGMARGLDAVAQSAALDAGFPTIGVLGNGVDVIYPWANRPLYERVYSEGLLLTEHAPGATAHAAAFPRRNRLISGLARAVIVVEAADGSGTMLTVASALEQGKEVLAVPGPILNGTSRGTNRLIRDGATPLLDVDQFLALYGAVRSGAPTAAGTPAPPCDLSPTEARVFNALSDGGRHVDELAEAAGLPIGELLGTLLGLELGGLADQLPGNCYRRRPR